MLTFDSDRVIVMTGSGVPENVGNFDFLRLTAAIAVLVSHQAPANGEEEWVFMRYHSLGGLGVLVFFVISGFLVCGSWHRDPSIWRFPIRRILRLWPGLAGAVFITTLVLGPAATTFPLSGYFDGEDFHNYFRLLAFDLWGRLPGVFDQNPISLINVSLWTIPIELRWYWVLMGLGVLQIVRLRLLLLIVTLALAYHYFIFKNIEDYLSNGGRRGFKEEFGLFFLAGAVLQRYQNLLSQRPLLIGIAAIGAGSCLVYLGRVHIGFCLMIPIVVVSVGTRSWPLIRDAGRFGDLSYGIYMYAFPVQQLIVLFTHNRLSAVPSILLATVVVSSIAFCSWRLVEQPALRWKPRTREKPTEYFSRVFQGNNSATSKADARG